MNRFLDQPLIKLLFFGNYFYGFCVIMLSTEAALQQKFPLNDWPYYILCFCMTVLYYSRAYLTIQSTESAENVRNLWYQKNKKLILWSQWCLVLISLSLLSLILTKHFDALMAISPLEIFLLFLFPLFALLYYGLNSRTFKSYNLRNIGWLKPFTIGFIWSGAVTIYPIIYSGIQNHVHYSLNLIALLLFLKNFMFVSVLSIMFDIKDYAQDYNEELKTVVVKIGLRKTIFVVIMPLCLLGLGSFIFYGISRDFHWMKIGLNTIPFVLTLLVAFELKKRQSIFFYLIAIDGLMLLKALFGITAMVYF